MGTDGAFPMHLGGDRLPMKRQEGRPMRRREFIAGLGIALSLIHISEPTRPY